MVENLKEIASLELLLKHNREFLNQYKTSLIMDLIKSTSMSEKKKRECFLDCIQTFSNYFQKTVMLRNVFCDNPKFLSVTQVHLKEEFGHDLKLMDDRKNKAPAWDAILDATAAWFTWKMFTCNDEEKTVLMHLVLEASANIFFREAHKIMNAYDETDYFNIHAAVDAEHEQMGHDLLKDLTSEKYRRLIEIHKQGWDVLNAVCDRIVYLTQLN